MEILIWGIVFLISIAVLVKSADYFVEGAEALGAYFHVAPFIIGVFVLGLGTSLPELIVSVLAAFKNTPEIIVGNVLGSNITNIFLILGVSAVAVSRSRIKYNFLEFDIPLFITSAFLMAVMIWNGIFSRPEGTFFLGIFTVYIYYTIITHRKERALVPEEVRGAIREKMKPTVILKLILSPVFIYLGARYTVESVIWLSALVKIGSEVIAASAIALGTSLPELMVSFAAVKRGKIDEMVGNIIGSNIFNIFVVMGIPALIAPILVPQNMILFALPLMLTATFVAFVIIKDKEVTRWEGIILLVFYVFFLARLYNLI